MQDIPIHPKTFLVIFALCAVLAPILTMVWLQPLEGDLTRIGRLPEALFGRNAVQPVQRHQVGNVDALAESDVLVLGDSFSVDGLWQPVALGDRDRFSTLRLTGSICPDLPEHLHTLGVSPRVLVVQMVERHLKDFTAPGCRKSGLKWLKPSSQSQPALTKATRPTWVFSGEFGYRYVTGAAPFMLWPRELHREGSSGGVRVQGVEDGCLLFSNRRCDLGLFLGRDAVQPTIQSDLASAMADALTATIAAAPVVVLVVVPNKSSVYLETIDEARRKDGIVRQLGKEGRLFAVPLFEKFHRAARQTRDFYLPNDTHLSPAGQVFLGQELRTALASVPAGSRVP